MTIPTLPGKVQAGDLITSDFMDKIIDVCEDLQERVAKLEGGSVVSNKMEIFSPKPGDTHRINEEIHVIGVNFGSKSDVAVFIDSSAMVTSDLLKNGSDDKNLIFNIPFVQNIPTGGRPVNLSVRNSATGGVASTQFLLQQPTVLPDGTLTVTYTGAPAAATLLPSTTGKVSQYTFVYTVRGWTNMTEDYSLTSTSNWPARIVNEHDTPIDPKLTLDVPSNAALPAKASVRVQVDMPTTATGSTPLKLKVTSKNNPNGGLNKESDEETLTVNLAPPTANAVAVSLVSANAPLDNGVIVAPQPQSGTTKTTVIATFKAEVPVTGTYSIQAITFPNDTSGKWTASVIGASSGIAMNPPEYTFRVSINGLANAPTATMLLIVVKDGSPNTKGDLYQIIRMS